MARVPQIRLATRADANEIARHSKEMIEHGLGWSYTPAKIRRAIARDSRNVIVADCDQRLAGFAIMSYKRQSANLDLLGVTDDHRRRGLGRSLLHWLEKCAATAGIVHHHVQVRKRNQPAITFYSKSGYEVSKEIAGYYSGRESAVVMYKCTAGDTDYPELDLSRFFNPHNDNANRR